MNWMECVDLRSDTVTWPTAEMRQAMAIAKVGDDVMNDDPSVNELQEKSAAMLGKEAGLFVPSGTMGNLIAILSHCRRGDEMIAGDQSHTFRYEAGGSAALAGVHTYLLPNQPDGTLDLGQVDKAVRNDDEHEPVSRLLSLENTHNRCGGVVLSVEYMEKACQMAHQNNLLVHVDGARLFNAAAALEKPARELVQGADSVTFCLSKGLCAPVGSVLCGSKDFIRRARRARKILGGGMRQAGVLAAAGLIAIEKMTGRLSEDHRRARDLARGLAQLPGLVVENPQPQTNMVFLHLADEIQMDADEICRQLEAHQVLAHSAGKRRFRLVTHYWVDDGKVNQAVEAFGQVLAR